MTLSLSGQTTSIGYLQGSAAAAATGNGNGTPVQVDGYVGSQLVEIHETGGGTCTVTLQGSLDGQTWYAVGYQQVDATATPARAVAAVTVTANMAHTYQVLDFYQQIRAVVSAAAGPLAVTIRVYAVPSA